jgi:hypothetical protein
LSRELPNWLEGYLRYTENSEPPRSYHTWCGLSLVAGALQRKVYLHWGFERIYPNLFVVLVGPSGRARKGVALGIAKNMLARIANVCMAPEASSREAVILAMKRSLVNFQDPTDNRIKFHCSLTAFSEELSVLLGQGDIKLLANLTDWYDSKDEWAYETVGRGRDALQGLCFNLLGATAPEWLQSMLPQEAIGGGFTSRVIFVVEERKGKTVAEHQLTEEELLLEESLTRDLERINQLKGEFHFTPEGKQSYVDWYKEQDALLERGKAAVEDTRFAGYCERRATHIRKLMILISACRGDSLKLTELDFEAAKTVLEMTEIKMAKTFGGLGQAKYSDATEKVINYVRLMGSTTRSVLLARFYRDVDSFTLRNIEEVMQQMKVVEVKALPDKGEKMYTWVGKK